MAKPQGKEMFRTATFQDLGFTRDGELEEGVCSSLTALWIRRTFELGDMTAASQFGKLMFIEIAQAAYEFGQLGKGKTDEDDIISLLEANNLKATYQKDVFNRKRVEYCLRSMLYNFGCYYFTMEEKDDDGGHSVGFKAGGTGFFIFDANQGLYKATDSEAFVKDYSQYLLKDYPEMRDAPTYCYRCKLDVAPTL